MPAPREEAVFELVVDEKGERGWRWFVGLLPFDLHLLRNLGRLGQNRFLLYALTVRGIRARYKQSLLGVGWALMTPAAMTAVFVYLYSLVQFDQRKQFPCPPALYLLFTLSFWSFFTKAVTNGSTSLVSNMDLVTKVYFPREVLPISSALMNLVDWVLAFGMYVVVAAGFTFLVPSAKTHFAAAYPFLPHAGWLWLPVLLAVHLLFILGLVFVASAMQVYFRDVGHLVNLGLFLWLVITPVLYPLRAFAGGRYTMLININPMTGIIDGYRLALISRMNPWDKHVIASALVAIVLFLVGYCFFKHEERHFADAV
ncbi:ABC transporter permease [Candidatus Sumerlaeota bacterium]|nr:ABC transporter permease [Candidatus Sumerlaeota bacterium]